MDTKLNHYLETIERYLKAIPASERIDIVKEIKSEILELERNDKFSPEQIIRRLGDPRELAKGYLGESIVKNNQFSWRKLGAIVAFYGLAGFGTMFILPITSVLSVGLMLCGIIAPIAGIIKFGGFLLGIEVPFVMIQIGNFVLHPLLTLPCSIIMGLLLFLGGKACWQLTIKYIKTISHQRKKLQEQ